VRGAGADRFQEERDLPEENKTNRSSDVLIDVQGLVKHYGRIKAVDGISFQVRRGDILGFLGPNGAGKTTAMRMITGFLEPDQGAIQVAGHDLASHSLEARRRIGYLSETAPAYGEMTVSGFLEFIAEAREVSDVEGAIGKVVQTTGIERVVHQSIETLSKGFQRRVGLAQALIHDPEVLILDEPTDGLDPNQKAVVQELITSLSVGKAIVLSTHILDEAERICSRALIISQGRILVDSTPGELIAQAPSHNVIRLSLAVDLIPEVIAKVETAEWCERVERWADTMLDVYPRSGGNHLDELMELVSGIEIHSVHLQEGRFDEYFREITRGIAA
jgi:ABC-2 type transport system ATP-binding protein